MIIYIPEGCSARTCSLSYIGLYADAIQQEVDYAVSAPAITLIYHPGYKNIGKKFF